MNCCAVECLPQRLPTAILSRARGERDRVRMHERVVEHDVGALEQPRGAQASAGPVRRGPRRRDRRSRGAVLIGPSPRRPCRCVASSIRMKLPVRDCRRSGRRTTGCASASAHVADVVHRAARPAPARATASRRSTGDRCARRGRALRASCAAADSVRRGVERRARRASTAMASTRARNRRRATPACTSMSPRETSSSSVEHDGDGRVQAGVPPVAVVRPDRAHAGAVQPTAAPSRHRRRRSSPIRCGPCSRAAAPAVGRATNCTGKRNGA